MNKSQQRMQTALFCLLSFFSIQAKFETNSGDFDLIFSGMYKPEMFAGKNVELLNNNNIGNKIWFERHTIDLNMDILYGKKTYNKQVAEFFFTVRNKGIWGNPESIASTTEATTKVLDTVGRSHRHGIPRYIFWMRALWIDFSLSDFLGLPFINQHNFKLGIFPFQLGRGIALGTAYAVGPELLGFYSDSLVDQFAPGGLIHGDIVPEVLSYDLYAAILQNKNTGLSETGAAIYGQEYGRRASPQRGSGKISFLIATRLNWNAFNNTKIGKLSFEPYALYNRDPEQRVEYVGDAISQLGTVGLASEYKHKRFEMGFDYAFNIGQQRVKGWDRNQVQEDNRDGLVAVANTHVVDQKGKKIPFIGSSSNAQKLIHNSVQDESENGQLIGIVEDRVGFVPGPVNLINAINRFRNPYTNDYRGWMFVVDAAYNILNADLKLAAMTGITTGDDNPNNETVDAVYTGFIPLQEAYAGDRVKSAFLLGGAGKLRRPLSTPESNQSPNQFAQINGFTNLVFYGNAIHWKPSWFQKEYYFNINGIAYWQEKPILKFDALSKKQLNEPATTFLGVEISVFTHYYVFKDLKLFFVGSVFFPGSHYRDILGKPLNSEQKRYLDDLDVTGFDLDRIPNLGKDTAYTLDIGLEFKF